MRTNPPSPFIRLFGVAACLLSGACGGAAPKPLAEAELTVRFGSDLPAHPAALRINDHRVPLTVSADDATVWTGRLPSDVVLSQATQFAWVQLTPCGEHENLLRLQADAAGNPVGAAREAADRKTGRIEFVATFVDQAPPLTTVHVDNGPRAIVDLRLGELALTERRQQVQLAHCPTDALKITHRDRALGTVPKGETSHDDLVISLRDEACYMEVAVTYMAVPEAFLAAPKVRFFADQPAFRTQRLTYFLEVPPREIKSGARHAETRFAALSISCDLARSPDALQRLLAPLRRSPSAPTATR